MLKRFLLYIVKVGRSAIEEDREISSNTIHILSFPVCYSITEVELEVLRQGNKDIQIHGKAGDTTLKLKKRVDRALYKRELENANAILGGVRFEEVNGKLYLISFVDLPVKKIIFGCKGGYRRF